MQRFSNVSLDDVDSYSTHCTYCVNTLKCRRKVTRLKIVHNDGADLAVFCIRRQCWKRQGLFYLFLTSGGSPYMPSVFEEVDGAMDGNKAIQTSNENGFGHLIDVSFGEVEKEEMEDVSGYDSIYKPSRQIVSVCQTGL
jgi:hypothetical protein